MTFTHIAFPFKLSMDWIDEGGLPLPQTLIPVLITSRSILRDIVKPEIILSTIWALLNTVKLAHKINHGTFYLCSSTA
jgi:hypothetical protein